MTRSKQLGTAFETQVTKFLRVNGFTFAERRPLSGSADRGDILVCPGVIIEAKAGKAAMSASDGQIKAWLAETEKERRNAGAAIALLVTKRSGVGPARTGESWCHLDGGVFADLVYIPEEGEAFKEFLDIPVRTHLASVVALLRDVGFGDPR